MENLTTFSLVTIVLLLEVAKNVVNSNNDTCSTPDGLPGNCINIRNCSTLLELLNPIALTPYNRNFLVKSKCGEDGKDPKVCCKLDQDDDKPTKIQALSLITNERPPEVKNHTNLRFLDLNNCGFLNTRTATSLVNTNQVPWMALLKYKDSQNKTQFFCDGQIISRLYILTTAACVSNQTIGNNQLIGVRVGEYDDEINKDCVVSNNCDKRFQDFGIDKVIPHPEYSKRVRRNDIALIKLDRQIDCSSGNIRPICLPLGEAVNVPSENLILTGHGQDISKDLYDEEFVRSKLNVTQYPQDQCENFLSDPNGTKIWYKHMCASGIPESIRLLSGSALQAEVYYNRDYRFIVYGLLSFGYSFPSFDNPDAYTQVNFYVDWILDNMESGNIVQHNDNKTSDIPGLSTMANEPPPDVKNHPNLRFFDQSNCGLLNSARIDPSRINKNEVPWMALLTYDNGEELFYLCDGTIISSLYIITTAYCVVGFAPVVGVRVGQYDDKIKQVCAASNDCDKTFQDFGVVQVIPHSEYSNKSKQNNIALIKLDHQIDFSSGTVRPICLPLDVAVTIPSEFILTGHGNEIYDDFTEDLIRLKLNKTQYPQDECARFFSVRNSNTISHKHICANGSHNSSVQYLPGSALQAEVYYNHNDRFILYGMYSIESDNPSAPIPEVYTRVDYYVDWILDNVKNMDSSLHEDKPLKVHESSRFGDKKPPNVKNHPNLHFLDRIDCGLSNPTNTALSSITMNYVPWMALLIYNNTENPYLCDGTVISNLYIITAAACTQSLAIYNLHLVGVRVGEYDDQIHKDCIVSNDCDKRYQDFGIDKIILHSYYSRLLRQNDIALIKLDHKIDFSFGNVRPICLPLEETGEISSDKFLVTGHGRRVTDGRPSGHLLRLKINVTQYPQDQCEKILSIHGAKIWHKNICVKRTEESLQNIMGSALTAQVHYKHNHRYTLYGILSFGLNPGAYTRVEYYVDWILDNIENGDTVLNTVDKALEKQEPPKSDQQPPAVEIHPNLHFFDQMGCGLMNPANRETSSRLYLFAWNDKMKMHQVPWMALLKYNTSENVTQYLCDATVINNLYVITAASCVTDVPTEMKLIGVRVGEYDDKIQKDCSAGNDCDKTFQDFRIAQVIPHPEYSEKMLRNDIALIKLDREIDFKSGMFKPICLPLNGTTAITVNNFMLTAHGYNDLSTKVLVTLKHNTSLYPHDQCANMITDNNRTKIWYKHICVSKEEAVMIGISGGSLQAQTFYKAEKRFVLYGILSFGLGGERSPAVYTRVDYYVDWILDTMKNENSLLTEQKIGNRYLQPPDVKNHPNLHLLHDVQCCRSYFLKGGLSYVYGGAPTVLGEFPWMALLTYNVGGNAAFHCGGTVISARYVLTAAHCVTELGQNKLLFGVRVGEYNWKTERDCNCDLRHIDFGIEEVIVHSEFNITNLRNDIALIRLNRKIDFTTHNVQTICLPIESPSPIPDELLILGWGLYNKLGQPSPTLLKAPIPHFSQEECASIYKNETKVEIWDKQLCAGGIKGVHACQGDSGGPIQAQQLFKQNGKRRNRTVQYGITSFSIDRCGTSSTHPGVYTRVDYYLDWILDNMRK